jgi:hypothetical protein
VVLLYIIPEDIPETHGICSQLVEGSYHNRGLISKLVSTSDGRQVPNDHICHLFKAIRFSELSSERAIVHVIDLIRIIQHVEKRGAIMKRLCARSDDAVYIGITLFLLAV